MSSPRKFRVWSNELKQWITHCVVLAPDGVVLTHSAGVHEDGKIEHRVNLAEPLKPMVEQFTGVLSADGIEVWEGDIMENGNDLGVVSFDSSAGCFYLRPVIKLRPEEPRLMGSLYWGKVLGNIHQNPELLAIK